MTRTRPETRTRSLTRSRAHTLASVAASAAAVVVLGAVSACSGSGTSAGGTSTTGGPGGAASAMSAPSGPRGTAVPPIAADAKAATVSTIVADVVVPTYERLATDTADLATATTTLCATPGAGDPTAARAAWRKAIADWAATEAFRSGPVMTLEAESSVAFAVDLEKVDKLLASTEPPTPITESALRSKGADVRGLRGVEAVLFADPPVLDERRCSYAVAGTAIVAAKTAAVADAWRSDPTAGGMWSEPQAAVTDLVNGSIHALNEASTKRLGKASGDITGTPAPAENDAGAAHSLQIEADASVDGVLAVWRAGLAGLVAGQNPDTQIRVDGMLTEAGAKVAAVPDPVHDIGTDAASVAPLSDAYESLVAPLIAFRTEVASTLGVTLSFSDSDGDS